MEKLDLVNTVISGIVVLRIGKEYIYCKPPSAEDKTFADFFSQEQYDDALIDGIWTQEDAENHLIELGYWNKEDDDKLKELRDNIDNMKLDYFNQFYNSQTKEYIKRAITGIEDKVNNLYTTKHTFYDKTCEYIKSYAFESHVLSKNAFLSNGQLASDKFSIHKLISKFKDQTYLIGSRAREVAKSDAWKNYWFSLKHEAFDNKRSTLTGFQLSVVGWSSYYEGVYQSMDKPFDEIIEDDIAIDGWSISQRRKRKEEEKQRNAEKMLPKNMSDAGEVFIPVRNQREAQDVMSLNDGAGKAKLKSLKRDLETRGSLSEADLTSTRQSIQMQAAEMSKHSNRRR